jgi:peptide-methionine (S)-S-oxide reductase
MREIVLAGGCFWCVEAVFRRIPGVVSADPGYSGGTTEDPRYEDVCSGATGHLEVARVRYDEGKVSLESVLDVFLSAHDPSSRDRQGADAGVQYRSAVFYASGEEREAARGRIEAWEAAHGKKAVTELYPLERFWPAEDYHKAYFEDHRRQPYCAAVIEPKLKKLGLL